MKFYNFRVFKTLQVLLDLLWIAAPFEQFFLLGNNTLT